MVGITANHAQDLESPPDKKKGRPKGSCTKLGSVKSAVSPVKPEINAPEVAVANVALSLEADFDFDTGEVPMSCGWCL